MNTAKKSKNKTNKYDDKNNNAKPTSNTLICTINTMQSTSPIENQVFYNKLVDIIKTIPRFMITHSLYWQLKGLEKCVEQGPIQNTKSPENCIGESFYLQDSWRTSTKMISAQSAANISIEDFKMRSCILYNQLAFN